MRSRKKDDEAMNCGLMGMVALTVTVPTMMGTRPYMNALGKLESAPPHGRVFNFPATGAGHCAQFFVGLGYETHVFHRWASRMSAVWSPHGPKPLECGARPRSPSRAAIME